jgi:hypothetical protein
MAFPVVNFLRQAITGSTFGKSKLKIKLVVDTNGVAGYFFLLTTCFLPLVPKDRELLTS